MRVLTFTHLTKNSLEIHAPELASQLKLNKNLTFFTTQLLIPLAFVKLFTDFLLFLILEKVSQPMISVNQTWIANLVARFVFV
jgi:hypothetical protein